MAYGPASLPRAHGAWHTLLPAHLRRTMSCHAVPPPYTPLPPPLSCLAMPCHAVQCRAMCGCLHRCRFRRTWTPENGTCSACSVCGVLCVLCVLCCVCCVCCVFVCVCACRCLQCGSTVPCGTMRCRPMLCGAVRYHAERWPAVWCVYTLAPSFCSIVDHIAFH